jgi:hypothetical protein
MMWTYSIVDNTSIIKGSSTRKKKTKSFAFIPVACVCVGGGMRGGGGGGGGGGRCCGGDGNGGEECIKRSNSSFFDN